MAPGSISSSRVPPLSQLFSSIPFGPLTLPNRIVIAPMCQYSCVDGLANDWHRIHLGQLSQSGAGLLIPGSHRRAAGRPHQLGRPGPVG